MKDLKRPRKIKWGSMGTEERRARDGTKYKVYVYRYFDNQVGSNGKRKRPKLVVGRTDEMTEDEAWLAVNPQFLSANAKNPQGVVITMGAVIQRYIHEILEPCLLPFGGVQSEIARMSHGCASGYINNLRWWVEPKWGTYDVRDFERNEVRTTVGQWLFDIVKSPTNPSGLALNSVRSVCNVMRQVFKWGMRWGYVKFNPLADDFVERPRGTTSQQHVKKAPQLTAAQFFLLEANLDLLPRTAVVVDCWLASRRSEAFGLKWKDLNVDDGVITFRQGFVGGRVTPLKNEPSRSEMPVPPDALKLLREWREITVYKLPDDWIFASPYTKGKLPYDPESMMKKHIRPVALRLGLPRISWHSFRHSASRWAKAALKKLEDAKEILRHEDIATTSNIYGGMPLEEKRAVQQRLVRYVKQKAKSEGWNGNAIPIDKKKKAARKRLPVKRHRAS